MRTKRALNNIMATLIMQMVTIACGFIVPKLIIQTFGSSVNGLVTSIIQFLAYITLLESGMGPVVKAILYKPIANKNKEEIENILKATEKFFRIISYIFIIYVVALCVIFPIIMKSQFDIGFTLSLVIIISISTFSEYYFGMTYKLYLQAAQKVNITSNIQTITTILNTIMVITLIKLGSNIQIVKLVSASIYIFRPILQNIYVKKKYNINFKKANLSYKIEQKWDGLAQHIAAIIHGNTDVVILTIFANIKEVSVYSVYLLVINGVKNVVSSFTSGIDALFGDMIAKNEKEKLQKTFNIYELFYFSIIAITFTSTLVLIVPFVKVYTSGIADVDYNRPIFAYIMVLAEFMHSIRLPYSTITLAAGHFKQTQKGAWIEACTNIILSIILVINFGIVGVAIGTLIAMTIRTIEFIIHTSKYILYRKSIYSFIKIVLLAIQVTIVVLINNIICNNLLVDTYMTWILYATTIFIITTIVVFITNITVYKKDIKEVIALMKNGYIEKEI